VPAPDGAAVAVAVDVVDGDADVCAAVGDEPQAETRSINKAANPLARTG
jgi:hypothetical protein